jgi:hypothetical protein
MRSADSKIFLVCRGEQAHQETLFRRIHAYPALAPAAMSTRVSGPDDAFDGGVGVDGAVMTDAVNGFDDV